MNIHMSHVMTIHTLSTIRHYSFPLAVNPVNCYVVCYIDSLIHVCFVDLNFFFPWPTSFSTIFVMFIFRFILFMFGPTCASNITFYFFSGHNCISANGSMSCQTHALHCMLISHGLLYMVMSKGLHVTDVDVFHTCNWTVCCMYWTGVSGVGSTGVVGANATICLSRGPREAPLYMSHIPFTVLKLGGF